MSRNKGSFKDPAGYVFNSNGKIFRSLSKLGDSYYHYIKNNGLLENFCNNRWLVGTKEVSISDNSILLDCKNTQCILEHESIPYISYPYEWTFSLLKSAALFHLKLQREALKYDTSMSDACAYNVQFIGRDPIFIDVLSFTPYTEGQYWLGYNQFCQQFLLPLLLQSSLGLPYNTLYKGYLNGIPFQEVGTLFPFYYRFSMRMQLHFYMPDYLQKKSKKKSTKTIEGNLKKSSLSRGAYLGIVKNLEQWIQKLKPRLRNNTWLEYNLIKNYTGEETNNKKQFIQNFVSKTKPELLFDLGCNCGEFSQLALHCGAGYVVGFDSCLQSLERAYATVEHKNFLPLFMDLTNPSPNQGWLGKERESFAERSKPDAILALALIHHLVIANNIPFEETVQWLISLAPCGVIEFIPKSSPVVDKMLIGRDDIFVDYNKTNLENYISNLAVIVKRETISNDGRILYWYQREERPSG